MTALTVDTDALKEASNLTQNSSVLAGNSALNINNAKSGLDSRLSLEKISGLADEVNNISDLASNISMGLENIVVTNEIMNMNITDLINSNMPYVNMILAQVCKDLGGSLSDLDTNNRDAILMEAKQRLIMYNTYNITLKKVVDIKDSALSNQLQKDIINGKMTYAQLQIVSTAISYYGRTRNSLLNEYTGTSNNGQATHNLGCKYICAASVSMFLNNALGFDIARAEIGAGKTRYQYLSGEDGKSFHTGSWYADRQDQYSVLANYADDYVPQAGDTIFICNSPLGKNPSVESFTDQSTGNSTYGISHVETYLATITKEDGKQYYVTIGSDGSGENGRINYEYWEVGSSRVVGFGALDYKGLTKKYLETQGSEVSFTKEQETEIIDSATSSQKPTQKPSTIYANINELEGPGSQGSSQSDLLDEPKPTPEITTPVLETEPTPTVTPTPDSDSTSNANNEDTNKPKATPSMQTKPTSTPNYKKNNDGNTVVNTSNNLSLSNNESNLVDPKKWPSNDLTNTLPKFDNYLVTVNDSNNFSYVLSNLDINKYNQYVTTLISNGYVVAPDGSFVFNNMYKVMLNYVNNNLIITTFKI